MTRSLCLLLVACTFWLAACDDSPSTEHHAARHYKLGDGAIDLHDDTVVIRAGGTTQDAHVASDGSLSIGSRPIDISTEARTALKQYDTEAIAIAQHGEALGKIGLEFGLNTVREVIHGLFNGTVDKAGEHAAEGAEQLVGSVRQLCERLDQMYQAQQSAAALIPEFKPYAVIAKHQVDDCFKDDDAKPDDDDDGDEAPRKTI